MTNNKKHPFGMERTARQNEHQKATTMMKSTLAAVLLLAGAMSASAQGYTTLGIGIDTAQATLHVHSATPVSNGGGNPGGGSAVNPNPGGLIGPLSIDPIFFTDYRTSFKMTNSNTADGGFEIRQNNLGVTIEQKEEANLVIKTPGGAVYFDPNGNVGIGTNSPAAGLHVAETAFFSQPVTLGKTLEVDQTLHAYGGLAVTGMFNVGTALTVMGGTTSCGTLHVSGSQTVGGGLDVGGNQTTQGNLTVGGDLTVGDGFVCDTAGNMKVKHLRVTTTDWPDYVFAEGYRLMPLHDVESYVKEKGHLPEVPAAAEMERDGVDQGELNRLLMQKVEELTLYIIDLQKQIEELKNK